MNNFAITSKGIGDALQRSASALVEGGNSIDEAIALVTAANSVIQNPEQVGTALKTLSLRLRGTKTELEETGADVDGMANSVSQLRDKLLALTKGKVDIMIDDKTFKNTTQVLREMAGVWQDLDDISRASALELMGGKRQANILSSIITNFQTVEDVIQTSSNAAGSALAENQKYMDSIQGKLDILTNSWQTMWNNALNSDFLKFIIEALTFVVNLIDEVGGLNVAVTALIANLSFKFTSTGIIPLMSTLTGGLIPKLTAGIASMIPAIKAGSTAFKLLGASLTGITGAGVIAGIMLLVKAIDHFYVSAEEIRDAADKAKTAIDSISSEFESSSKTVSDISERFAELAQGVDTLTGKNISLTTDDYKEFLDLSNQLADIFPTLSRRYDENGNALVQLSGDTDTIVGSLQNLLDVERQIANQKIAENLPDLYAGVKLKSDNYNEELKSLESQRDSYISQLDYLTSSQFKADLNTDLSSGILRIYDENGDTEALNRMYDEYTSLLDKLDLNYQELTPEYKYDSELGFDKIVGYNFQIDYTGKTDEEIADIQKRVSTGMRDIADTYSNEISNLNLEIQSTINENKANWSSILSSISSWLSTDSSYKVLSDDMQSVIQQMISNIDFSKLENVDTWEGMQQYIQDNIISRIQSATPKVQEQFSKLFKINPSILSTEDYISQVNSIAQEISDISNFTKEEVLKNTGYQDMIDQYENTAQDILRMMNKTGREAERIKEKIYSLSPNELMKAFNIIKQYGIKTWNELEKALNEKTFDVVVDYDKEQTGIENLQKAIKESISATGLSAESISSLKSRYSELVDEGYNLDKLFEETTNGIHLNTKALGELEQAYNQKNIDGLNTKLESLKDKYNDLTEEINNCSDSAKRADLYAQRNNIITQIRDTATLASQYKGLTSAYNQWQNAQSAGDERDMYEGIISGKKELEEEMKRGWIDQGTREYLELLSGKDLSTTKYDEILQVYKDLNKEAGAGYNVFDFFTKDSDGNSTTEGIFNFLDAVKAKQKELGKEWVKIGEDGSYTFDFGINGDKAVAEALGISEELVQIILRAAKDAGFDIDLSTAYSELADLRDMAEEANDKLKLIGATDYTFNIYSTNLEDINTQITKAQEALDTFKSSDGVIQVEADGCEEVQILLATLIRQKQSLETPAVLEIDTNSASTEVQNVMSLVKEFKDNYNTLEVQTAIGEDTSDTQAKLGETIAKLQAADPKVLATLEIDPTKSQEDINTSINAVKPEMFVDLIPDKTAIEAYQTATESGENDIEAKVVWENVSKEVDTWRKQNHDIEAKVVWKNDTSYIKTTITARGTIVWDWADYADGTAHVRGTLPPRGSAFAGGSWGAPKTETALVGELGPEILVRNGRWTTVGDNGVEFTDIKKGDIIFNHKQTEDLLSKGYATGRGKAYANGTAYSGGNGPGRYTVNSTSISGSENSSKNQIDFIEIKLNEFEAALSKTTAMLENFLDDTSDIAKKSDAYDKLVKAEKEKASTYFDAAEYYNKKATELLEKVPAEYREKAKNGAIDVKDFVSDSEEKIAEAIENYRDMADKADNAETSYLESIAEISTKRIEQLNDIAGDFENIIGLIDANSTLIQSNMDLVEAQGNRLSASYYNQLIDNTYKKINDLNNEKANLESELQKAIAAGDITVGKDDWFEAMDMINSVSDEIVQCRIDIEEFQDAIIDLKWDALDKLISRFDFLDSQLSHLFTRLTDGKVVDDNGEWNEKGIAAMGVAAEQMDLAKVKSQQYANAIADLNSNWESWGMSVDQYNEKLAELTENQWDSIEAYEDAKDALVSLNKTRVDAVKNAMKKELDAYKKLIDAKKEALNADKDAYDFEKSVKEQQKNIDDIERRLAALAGDTSMSAAAQRKKLQAELAQAQADMDDLYYNRSIENQQNAYDEEYDRYEEYVNDKSDALDKYLEDEEKVISDSMQVVKGNTEIVLSEIQGISEQYGVQISNEIVQPWRDGVTAVSDFGNNFTNASSSFINQLGSIIAQEKELEEQAKATAAALLEQLSASSQPTPTKPTGTSSSSGSGVGLDKIIGILTKKPENTSTSNTTNSAVPAKGSTVTVDKDATNFTRNGGNGTKMASFVPGGSFTVMQTNGNEVLIGRGGVATGWVDKSDLKGYAKGSKKIASDQLAIIDELGEELQLVPGKNGRLEYIKKGTGIIPADMTKKLMNLAVDPTNMLKDSIPAVTISNVTNNDISVDASIAELIHIDTVTNDTLPNLEKVVEKQMDKYVTKLNSSLRKYTR